MWSSASALVVGGLAVSGGPSVVAASGTASAPHVMVVMMENKNFSEVIGQSNQPFTNSLANNYGLATQSYACCHPSLPNYLDIVSGQAPANSTDDADPSAHTYSFPTLNTQLHAAGISERAYAENLNGNGSVSSGSYAAKHFPWVYFPASTMPIANSTSLVGDLNGSSPPSFVWYTPNLTNDEHDGSVQQGDAFLRGFIPSVQSTAWYRQGGQVIVTWDEADSDNSGVNGGDGGHVPTIVVSAANAARPVKDSTRVDTSGILRSIEDRYGLTHLANAANSANGTIDALLATSSTPPTSRSITNAPRATANAGAQFSFLVTTTGTPTPRLKKHGRLPRGLHFHNNHNGTAKIWGTPSSRDSRGSYSVTIIATYGKGKTKQTTSQNFTLTLSG